MTAAAILPTLSDETTGRASLPVLKVPVRIVTARAQQANALRAKIMTEAHARAKADYADELSCRGRAHHVNRPYSYPRPRARDAQRLR
ncbi:hypothetical protein ACFQX9_30160 [Bradyrhizobium sp. GCM10028915]|uniref:hypothetical protein n=1 Tax=Bradyrhizobium sp. GCM10028915 TaxID=3273385 RepID=UPI0036180871